MQSTAILSSERKEYFAPSVDVLIFDLNQDVVRVSGDGNDNDFGAGGLGGFVNGN